MLTETKPKEIKVLIGQISLTRAPNLLQSVLGSCIGLVMYDQVEGIGGMAHILLPSSQDRELGNLPGKYADRAVQCLYAALLERGAAKGRIKAKIAGGAKMFNAAMSYRQQDVGLSNIEAVRKHIREFDIPLVATDVGGTSGRKIEFDMVRYQLKVEDFAQRVQVI